MKPFEYKPGFGLTRTEQLKIARNILKTEPNRVLLMIEHSKKATAPEEIEAYKRCIKATSIKIASAAHLIYVKRLSE